MDESSAAREGETADSGDSGAGLGKSTEIPEESVASESDLALDNLDARRSSGDKQGDQ